MSIGIGGYYGEMANANTGYTNTNYTNLGYANANYGSIGYAAGFEADSRDKSARCKRR